MSRDRDKRQIAYRENVLHKRNFILVLQCILLFIGEEHIKVGLIA